MKPLIALVALITVARPADAHFHLDEPADWLDTDADVGNPQKEGPCGDPGPGNGAITEVTAGSTLHLAWTETIGHPGHYRVAFAKDRRSFVTPVPEVVDNDCRSAPIEVTPVAPVVADGLFVHDTPEFNGKRTYDLKVPDEPCDHCTVQIVEFMSNHPPSCFYFHCADVRVVAPASSGCASGGVGWGALAMLALRSWRRSSAPSPASRETRGRRDPT